MEGKNYNMEKDESTIDISTLWMVFSNNWMGIIASGIALAIIGFIVSGFAIPKKYTAEVLLYVENNQQQSDTINYNDLTVAQKLVNTCEVIFTSEYMMKSVQEKLEETKFSSDMVNVNSVNNTEVLSISVESGSANDSAKIANTFAELAPVEFKRVIKSGSIEIITEATVPKSHSFPSIPLFTALGLILGLVVTYMIFLVKEMLDVKIKPNDDLFKIYEIPVFAEIMDHEITSSGDYSYE